MSSKDHILSLSIDQLKELYGKTPEAIKDLISELADVEWLNTLDVDRINTILVRLAIIAKIKTFADIPDFINAVEKCKIKPTSISEENWLALYNHAKPVFENLMIEGFKRLTTGSTPRDPENDHEVYLYCLATAIQGKDRDKIPSSIVTALLDKIDLDVRTPNYNHDILDIICESSRMDYIRIILKRAIEEKTRTQLFEYIQDRWWINRREDDSTKFVEELEKVFYDLDLPFSVAVHGKYSKRAGILESCDTVKVLNICIKYFSEKHKSYILQKRAFSILCNFLGVDLKELEGAVTVLKTYKVDMEKIFEQRCKEKDMCLLDKVCLDYSAEKIRYILSKMSDDLKSKTLTRRNYGGRIPLTHARYYSRPGSDKETVIEEGMKRLKINFH